MKKITEAKIQKAVLDYLSVIVGVYAFRSGAGQIKTEDGRYFKTGKPGCPDIVCCYQGQFIGLEIKTKTGRQTALQKKAEQEIKDSGGQYYIIRCMDDIKQIFPPGLSGKCTK